LSYLNHSKVRCFKKELWSSCHSWSGRSVKSRSRIENPHLKFKIPVSNWESPLLGGH